MLVPQNGNVLNAMPKSVQAKAKDHLHDIWQAETRDDAEEAFGFFVKGSMRNSVYGDQPMRVLRVIC